MSTQAILYNLIFHLLSGLGNWTFIIIIIIIFFF